MEDTVTPVQEITRRLNDAQRVSVINYDLQRVARVPAGFYARRAPSLLARVAAWFGR